MTLDVNWKMNLNQGAKEAAQASVFEAIQEVFELDIKPAAQAGSPVLTGTNRRSIDTDVEQTEEGTKAELYTQSGYGGYLELGTRFMKAQPYLWPAFQKNLQRLFEAAKAKFTVTREVKL